MTELVTVTPANAVELMKTLNRDFMDIPMGNSKFQTDNFVISAAITPERAWRQVGLQLQTAVQNVHILGLNKRKAEIKRAQLEEKLADPNLDKWERKLLELDLEQFDFNAASHDKAMADALADCNNLLQWYNKFPKYTREQFEEGEFTHFLERSKRQVLNIQGGAESLYNIMHDLPFMASVADKLLTHSPEEIRALMTNRIPEAPGSMDLLGGSNANE